MRSYLDMLALELAGQQYSKSAFRDRLIEQLQGTRSKGSIEFKHCNISAVMQQLGYPSIQGYKRRNLSSWIRCGRSPRRASNRCKSRCPITYATVLRVVTI